MQPLDDLRLLYTRASERATKTDGKNGKGRKRERIGTDEIEMTENEKPKELEQVELRTRGLAVSRSV